MKTKLEIIEETANYYNLTNRGVDEYGCCVYYDKDTGNMCAVGRCLIQPKKLKDKELTVDNLFKTSQGFRRLKPEYKIKDQNFWMYLQLFHDNNANWTKKGLSTKGKAHLKKLKKLYKNE
jgi:hypothetical protein